MSRSDDDNEDLTPEEEADIGLERGILVLEASGNEQPGDAGLSVTVQVLVDDKVRGSGADLEEAEEKADLDEDEAYTVNVLLRIKGQIVGSGATLADAVEAAFAGKYRSVCSEHRFALYLAAVVSEAAEIVVDTVEAILEDEDDTEPEEPEEPVRPALRFRKRGGPGS